MHFTFECRLWAPVKQQMLMRRKTPSWSDMASHSDLWRVCWHNPQRVNSKFLRPGQSFSHPHFLPRWLNMCFLTRWQLGDSRTNNASRVSCISLAKPPLVRPRVQRHPRTSRSKPFTRSSTPSMLPCGLVRVCVCIWRRGEGLPRGQIWKKVRVD